MWGTLLHNSARSVLQERKNNVLKLVMTKFYKAQAQYSKVLIPGKKEMRLDMRSRLFFGWREDDVAVGHAAFFAALKIDGTGQLLVAIERAAGDAGNFLIVDDGLTVPDEGHVSANQGDVVGLPLAGLAWKFRRWREEAVNAADAMAGRLINGVGFDLNFVAAAQVDAAVGIGIAVKFDMQLEILELGIVDQFGAFARRDQEAVFDFPDFGGFGVTHRPSGEIFSVEERDRLSPFWRAGPYPGGRSDPNPRPNFAVGPSGSAGEAIAAQCSLKNHVVVAALLLFRRNEFEVAVRDLCFRQRAGISPATDVDRFQLTLLLG